MGARRRAFIMGLGDGAMSILGVVFYASGHPGLVIPVAISGGLTAACSMAGNEWLSDSGDGLGGAVAMFLATLAGSVLPAVPYAFAHGITAPALSLASLLIVALVVGRMRAGRKHPYLETVAVLAVIAAVSIVCALLLPGGAN